MSDEIEMDSKAIEARQLLDAARRIAPFQASPIAYEMFTEAAAMYRGVELFFEAGIAMSTAVDSAWGDPAKMKRSQQAALDDWQRALDTAPEQSPVALAASHKMSRDHWRATFLFDMPRSAVAVRV